MSHSRKSTKNMVATSDLYGANQMKLRDFIAQINQKDLLNKEVIFATSDGRDLEFLSIYPSDSGKKVYIDIGEEDE